MRYRVLFFVVLVLALFFLLIHSSSIAQQAGQPCDASTCGPGYNAVLQSNGSCMCVASDCTNLDDCPEPPKAIEDCASIEGCGPPAIIEP